MISDGYNTRVFFEPWLPDDVNHFVTTPVSDGLSNILVRSLMQQNVLAWDNDILNDLFNDIDVDIIRGIPLRLWRQEDKWYSDPRARFDLIGGSESKPGDAQPKPFIKYISFINVFVLKSLRKRFHFGASP